MRKKLFTFLFAALMSVASMWAQTETLLTTITATGIEQASYSTANVATVSFSYTAEGYSSYVALWGWWGYGWSATVNAAEGYTITKCIFYDDANRTATDSEAPFVVETTEEDKTPRINGTPILADESRGIKKIDVYGYENPTTVAVTGVTLNQNEAQMTVGGETLTLIATVNPNNATDQSVSWSTSDGDVATVDNGVVTAVAAGNATITVTTTDGSFTATCAVTVTAPEPEPQPTTVTWGATEFSSFGVDYLHAASRTVKGITVTVNAANQNFINVTEYGTTFNATIDNAFTFSTELGNITKIECTTLYTKGTLGDGWTIGANSATWEGNTNTLNFGNAGSMLVVSNIIFTIGGASTPEPEPQPVTDPITPYEDPQDANVYYSTFYDSNFKYELPTGVEAYVADLSGANLLLTKIAEAGEVIPADNAVILKSSVTPVILTQSDAAAVTFTATNDLQGSDTQIATPANCYVLAGTDGVVGFYHYTADNLNAHKAYVVYAGSNQAPRRMPFIFDAATGNLTPTLSQGEGEKILRDGQLIIIKNGVKFNAMGQIVK